MKGEDVFGCKINLFLEKFQQRPSQYHPPPQNHFPPSPPLQHPQVHPPPLFPRPPPSPVRPPPPPAAFHHLSGPALGKTFPPANRPPRPLMHPSPPLPRFTHSPPHPPPQLPPHQPPFPPNNMQNFPFGPPPFSRPPPPIVPLPPLPPGPQQPPRLPTGPAVPYSKMAATPAPPPEGKILVIKIPATDEADQFSELERRVLMLSLEANIKVHINDVPFYIV